VHLALIHKAISDHKPQVVVVDPITNFLAIGDARQTKQMLTRLIDFLKNEQITTIFTSLTSSDNTIEDSEVGVSSLMDVWLLVKTVESNGERNRGLYILKARGIAHSNQLREFRLTEKGIELVNAYVGSEGVLMGSARATQFAREAALAAEREDTRKRRERELQRKHEIYEAQLLALKNHYESEREAMVRELQEAEVGAANQRVDMAPLRPADVDPRMDENGARKARKGNVR